MDTEQAYVWRLQNFVLGEHILKPCPENPTPVKVGILNYVTILLDILCNSDGLYLLSANKGSYLHDNKTHYF